MTLYGLALGPFAEFGFMRRALVGCLVLALSCGPIGTILVIRRMSLMGDALSHAVLPGAALGFIMAGLSLRWCRPLRQPKASRAQSCHGSSACARIW